MTSYEEACKAAKVSPEDIESLGFDAAVTKALERRALTGWDTERLCAEARRRQHERLEEKS